MKKINFILLFILSLCFLCSSCSAAENADSIILQIGNPLMTVDNEEIEIDQGRDTAPIIVDGRTLLPVRTVIETMGGTVDWDSEQQTTVLSYSDSRIELKINSNIAYLNGEEKELDAVPVIINGRTMLPIRFIAESFGFNVDWNSTEQIITINKSVDEKLTSDADVQEATTNEDEEDKNINALIVYYSYTGNTKRVSERMAEVIGADKYEIKTVNEYPKGEYETADIAIEERRSGNLPELVNDLPDISGYDYIFVGGPVWNGDIAAPLAKYLEMTDLDGKIVVPFWTNKGSGEKAYINDFNENVRNPEVVSDGFGISFENEKTDEEIDDTIKAEVSKILSDYKK